MADAKALIIRATAAANRYLQRAREAEEKLAQRPDLNRAELRYLLDLAEGGNGGHRPGAGFSAEDVLALREKLKGVV